MGVKVEKCVGSATIAYKTGFVTYSVEMYGRLSFGFVYRLKKLTINFNY